MKKLIATITLAIVTTMGSTVLFAQDTKSNGGIIITQRASTVTERTIKKIAIFLKTGIIITQ